MENTPNVCADDLPRILKFSKAYNVESIPRFILIGPDGKIINATFPRPSQSSFELLLRKELGLGDELAQK